MEAMRSCFVLAAAVAIAAFPSAAKAQRVVPPGNSAVNQYTETFPTAGAGTFNDRLPGQVRSRL